MTIKTLELIHELLINNMRDTKAKHNEAAEREKQLDPDGKNAKLSRNTLAALKLYSAASDALREFENQEF